MKKTLTILFAFMYLVLNTGILLHLHCCGGEVKKISLVKSSKGCCAGEEEDEGEEDGCCKNEVKLIKANILQSLSKKTDVNFFSFNYIQIKYIDAPIISFSNQEVKQTTLPLNHAPPNDIPIFLAKRAILI